MNTKTQQFIEILRKQPKQIFLIDGCGAFLTAVFLNVLTTFQEYIGMSLNVLHALSCVAFIFAVYSISCYFLNPKNWQTLLKIIAVGNLTYCFLTIGYMYYFYERITMLGLLYFSIELLIIFILVILEFMATKPY